MYPTGDIWTFGYQLAASPRQVKDVDGALCTRSFHDCVVSHHLTNHKVHIQEDVGLPCQKCLFRRKISSARIGLLTTSSQVQTSIGWRGWLVLSNGILSASWRSQHSILYAHVFRILQQFTLRKYSKLDCEQADGGCPFPFIVWRHNRTRDHIDKAQSMTYRCYLAAQLALLCAFSLAKHLTPNWFFVLYPNYDEISCRWLNAQLKSDALAGTTSVPIRSLFPILLHCFSGWQARPGEELTTWNNRRAFVLPWFEIRVRSHACACGISCRVACTPDIGLP